MAAYPISVQFSSVQSVSSVSWFGETSRETQNLELALEWEDWVFAVNLESNLDVQLDLNL